TSIYVTHDQAEALVMSDRVVVIDKGVIQQIGDPESIYSRPANSFVANFIGATNLMEGLLIDRDSKGCLVDVPLGDGAAPVRLFGAGGEGIARGQRAILSVRPEDIGLHTHR